MINLRPAAFFELEGFAHADLFQPDEPAWSALGQRLVDYLEGQRDWEIHIELTAGVHLLGDHISIAPGCRIDAPVSHIKCILSSYFLLFRHILTRKKFIHSQ